MTKTEITIIDEIKLMFSSLKDKKGFIQVAANKLGRKPLYLKQHWFREYWAIPEEYTDRVKEMLTEAVEGQKASA